MVALCLLSSAASMPGDTRAVSGVLVVLVLTCCGLTLAVSLERGTRHPALPPTALLHPPPPPQLPPMHYPTTPLLRLVGLQTEINAAKAALTDLILFCTDSKDTDPFTRDGIPIMRHQRLLLDQNLHALAIHMLSAPFAESAGGGATYRLSDLADPANQDLNSVCALCYRLLRQMVKGSPPFALQLAEWIPFIQSQLGPCRLAADTLSEMFQDNRILLEQVAAAVHR